MLYPISLPFLLKTVLTAPIFLASSDISTNPSIITSLYGIVTLIPLILKTLNASHILFILFFSISNNLYAQFTLRYLNTSSCISEDKECDNFSPISPKNSIISLPFSFYTNLEV